MILFKFGAEVPSNGKSLTLLPDKSFIATFMVCVVVVDLGVSVPLRLDFKPFLQKTENLLGKLSFI